MEITYFAEWMFVFLCQNGCLYFINNLLADIVSVSHKIELFLVYTVQ